MLDYHPFDVVGWDGYVYPYTFNADDFEPRHRAHPPAAARRTRRSRGQNFVICSFCPRDARLGPARRSRCPTTTRTSSPRRSIYYVDGQFGSRKGVDVGMITLHPVRPAARAAARARREVARRQAHRGAGGDVGHVPPAAADGALRATSTSREYALSWNPRPAAVRA